MLFSSGKARLAAIGSITLMSDAHRPAAARGRPNSLGGSSNIARSDRLPLASYSKVIPINRITGLSQVTFAAIIRETAFGPYVR